jgi:hypothetical protein
MLSAAYAAAFHWSKVGKPINDMRADLLLAHVHALVGKGAEALSYAKNCLIFCEKNACEDWDLAFAHAEVAHAAAVIGDAELHAEHYATAKELGGSLKEAEDRKIFAAEFSRIPNSVYAA